MYPSKLFLSGSTNGAYVCAVTAGDALISIDYVLAVTLGNARGRAAVCACATSDALITNLESHCKILRKNFWQGIIPYLYCTISSQKIKSILEKNQNSCLVGWNIGIQGLVIL
jgi:hypothetical protein